MIDSSFQCLYYTNSTFANQSLSIQCWNEVFGIDNLSLSQSFNYSDPFILGGIEGPSQITSPTQTSLRVDKYSIDSEIFTLNSFSEPSCFAIFNGSIFHILTNAYLTDYSVSISVGDIPKISSTFASYEYKISNLPTLPTNNETLPYGMIPYYTNQQINNSGIIYTYPVVSGFLNQVICQPFTKGMDIVKLDSIFLSGSDANSLKNACDIEANQNIYSFNYSLAYNRQALFSVGDAFPIVTTIPPIKVSLSISSKVIKEEIHEIKPVIQDNLCFSVIVSGQSINNYCISGAKLISQEMEISCCNILDYKRNYIGYLL